MISDNAAEFTSETIPKVMCITRIRKLEDGTQHSDSHTLVERLNSKFFIILKIYCGKQETEN